MQVARVVLVLLAGGVVIANAGCGGGGGSARGPSAVSTTRSATESGVTTGTDGRGGTYESQMSEARHEVSVALGSLAKVAALSLRYPVRPTAAKEAAAMVSKAQRRLRDAESRMDTVTPPVEVRKDHARLARGVADLRAELTPLIKKLRRGYLVVAPRLPSLRGAAEISKALASLKRHGHAVGGDR